MAAAEYPTIPGLGPLPEMEDALASSIEGNSGGGGQKRKREEEDPSCLRIVRSRRLLMLESVVRVLKCFNSVLRFHVPADGDLGFRLETGSVEEQRIAGLIYSHVCSYILLYHLEKKKTNGDPPPIVEIAAHAYKGGVVRTTGGEVDEMMWDVSDMSRHFIQPLTDGRRALGYDSTLRQRNGNGGGIEVSSTFDELRDYNKGRRKQELMDVLHTLEVTGHSRGYAPPEDEEEALFYKEIRKQMSWYILHVHVRSELLAATGEKPCNDPITSDPFLCPDEQEALCFIPPLHQLEVSLEHMHEHLSHLKECKQRVTLLLSFGQTPVSDRVRDLVEIMRDKDAARSDLIRRKPTGASFAKPMSDCLDHVIAILGHIRCLDEQTPTEKEVRMYVQIGEHARSSIWLAHSLPPSQRKDKGSCEVYFDGASTDHDHSSLSKSDAQGKQVGTREQLLEEIMACLKACKSSCMGEVPSLEEEKRYITIWRELYPGLLECLRSQRMTIVDEEPEQMSESELSELESKVCYIFERVRGFIGEVRDEICSVAAAVHRALRPEELLSPEAAQGWFMNCEEDAVAKAKEFVGMSLSSGRMAELEHALMVLMELGSVEPYFFKLSSAVDFVEWACCDVKKYAMVASEVENAFDIIGNEKPLVK